jgi:hypothetical protein
MARFCESIGSLDSQGQESRSPVGYGRLPPPWQSSGHAAVGLSRDLLARSSEPAAIRVRSEHQRHAVFHQRRGAGHSRRGQRRIIWGQLRLAGSCRSLPARVQPAMCGIAIRPDRPHHRLLRVRFESVHYGWSVRSKRCVARVVRRGVPRVGRRVRDHVGVAQRPRSRGVGSFSDRIGTD